MRVAELLNQILRLSSSRAIGDFLAEVISFAKLFANDLDDVFRVRIVFSEDERLRHSGAARKNFREESIAKSANHGADLIWCNDRSIEFASFICEVVTELFPAHFACEAIALVHVETLLDFAAALRDLGVDLVNVVVHVHAVSDSLLVIVFHHKVLLEEAKRLLVRRRG